MPALLLEIGTQGSARTQHGPKGFDSRRWPVDSADARWNCRIARVVVTLFNALVANAQAQAANFPFCTIEPNVGTVAVPDQRLDQLTELSQSKDTIPTRMEFVDIAGLVKGASQGEGLGNKFLANIREVDAIVHVIRCFEDDDVSGLGLRGALKGCGGDQS